MKPPIDDSVLDPGQKPSGAAEVVVVAAVQRQEAAGGQGFGRDWGGWQRVGGWHEGI